MEMTKKYRQDHDHDHDGIGSTITSLKYWSTTHTNFAFLSFTEREVVMRREREWEGGWGYERNVWREVKEACTSSNLTHTYSYVIHHAAAIIHICTNAKLKDIDQECDQGFVHWHVLLDVWMSRLLTSSCWGRLLQHTTGLRFQVPPHTNQPPPPRTIYTAQRKTTLLVNILLMTRLLVLPCN